MNRFDNKKRFFLRGKAMVYGLTVFLCLLLAGCAHFASIYSSADYSLDDLKVDVDEARAETINGYKGYAGKVIKVSPINNVNWTDYSRSIYYDWQLNETGFQQITVSMSVLAENPASIAAETSAYRHDQRVMGSPTTIKWQGPGNIGWTVQCGETIYEQFGGNAVEIPTGEWVDLSFSQSIDVTGTESGVIYIDGHSDTQGLVDLTLYVRHFEVTMRTTNKFIALTFDDGPSDFTDILLDKLDTHGVKASFFLMGASMEARHPLYDRLITPQERPSASTDRGTTVKRIFDDGHDIGNLSYSHASLPEGALSADDIRAELTTTQESIQKAVYGEADAQNHPWVAKFFRDPFDPASEMGRSINNIAAEMNLPIIGGIDGGGGSSERSPEDIAAAIINQVEPWTVCINKDPRSDPSIIRVLDILIPQLKAQGYIFVTLSEMAEKRNLPLDPGIVYSNLNPDL